jgi:hypothetical protein
MTSCRRAGDDTRLACVETLTHRASQLEMVLSDPSRVDRDPEVLVLGDQYVGALEQTFRERCLGGVSDACGRPDRFVADAEPTDRSH